MAAATRMTTWFCLIVFTVSFYAFAEEKAEKTEPKFDPAKMAELLEPTADDVVRGKDDAPITLVEYSSMSCTHCATFHNTVLPTLKEKFIDPGHVRYINRAFPLNAPALYGTKLVKCAPEDKRAKFEEVLFKLQSKWAFTGEYKDRLKKIAAVGGMSEETFDACMENKEIEEAILTSRKEASETLPIEGTPSFFLNGEPFPASIKKEAFIEALEQKVSTFSDE